MSRVRIQRSSWLRLICSLSLACGAAGVQAADWKPVTVPGDTHFHSYDASRLLVKDQEVTFWRRVQFRLPQKVKAGEVRVALFREKIHCQEHSLQTLAWLLYADSGALLEQQQVPAEQAPVVPDTVGDAFEKAVCQLAADLRREAAKAGRPLPSASPSPSASPAPTPTPIALDLSGLLPRPSPAAGAVLAPQPPLRPAKPPTPHVTESPDASR